MLYGGMISQDNSQLSFKVEAAKIKIGLYNADGNVIQSEWVDAPLNLDNSITEQFCISTKGVDTQMKYKINRQATINGKRHWIRAQTEQEYADKIMKLCRSNDIEETEKHDFRTYAWNWFNTYSRPNVETVTANTYKQQLTKYLMPWLGNNFIEDITTDDIQRMFNSMNAAKSSKNKVKIVLNQILDAAVEDGIIAKSPLHSKRLKINGTASKETPPYSVEQMQHIVSRICDIKREQDRIFIALLAMHPMRLEEVLGLQWSDIDFEKGVLHIRRAVTHPNRNQPVVKCTKTDQSERVIALSKTAASYLLKNNCGNGFVVGGESPLSYTQVRRMCERIKKDIGFEDKITPIRFRTTVLTDIYDQTKDLRLTQDSGGHTTPTMTLKHYVKGRESADRSAQAIDTLYAGNYSNGPASTNSPETLV